MGVVQEFKDFAMKGNVVDLAVGVIIGGAFGKIISAMVDKVLMPIIGMIMGGVDFTNLKVVLAAAGADGKGEVAVGYGLFIQTVIDFLIVALCLFVVIKAMNSAKKTPPPAPAAPVEPSEDIVLLRQIRDSLKK
ncbi:MAG: large-conductance mechanosensitive channel protein MscL [Bdellovibrionaceae bacterium]|nr:large-conductance mechanosensitive channel protein MscL [Pseudobdellovibrionaceae bacterium]